MELFPASIFRHACLRKISVKRAHAKSKGAMMKACSILALLAALVLQPGCSDDDQPTASPDTDPTGISTVASAKQRATDLQVSPDDTAELVAGNRDFALRLFNAVREDSDGNFFYSPYSISLALAMTYAGARGDTEQEMAQTLDFSLPQEDLHAAFNAVDQTLTSYSQRTDEGEEGSFFTLNIANSIWGQHGFEFLDEFLDLLAENYGAGMQLVGFSQNPEQARGLINDWVAEHTENRILDLIREGAITTLTRLVLTNAIYFNASWQHPFEEAQTTHGTFVRLDGDEVNVPLMHQSVRTSYSEGDGYQAVELCYIGYQLSMIIFLPERGRFKEFGNGFDVARLAEITSGFRDTRVTLTMPRFQFDSSIGLSEILPQLGMELAFVPPAGSTGADFSGMNGKRELYIKDVLHKAFVSVDEQGTEAAASTAVLTEVTSMPGSATMTIDRPFVFLIKDRAGTILFVGRVLAPSS